MSAFICGPDHFKALAIFATSPGSFGILVDPAYVKGLEHPDGVSRGFANLSRLELANLYADVLYRENVRSVWARYPNDKRNSLPGPVDDPGHVTLSLRDLDAGKYRLSPVCILKMCDCLEYQSCETADWPETVARRLLDRIRNAAVSALPGYESAPWDFYAPEVSHA